MSSSHVVDTLIVLVAIFIGGAFVCSGINEGIAAALQLRGGVLYRGLVDLAFGWRDIIDHLYQHPLITGNGDPTPSYGGLTPLLRFLGNEGGKPSYLDARNFSIAFWQTLQGKLSPQPGQIAATAVDAPIDLLNDLKARVEGIDPTTPCLGPLKGTLGSMLTQAGTSYEHLLKLTDAWFNRQMDRVAGWYRRTSQWILLVIGLLIAFGLNIDTIHIATWLSAEPALAQQWSDSIVKAYANAQAAAPSTAASPVPSGASSPTPQQVEAQNAARAASVVDAAFSSANMPLSAFVRPSFPRPWSSVLGDLITALAFAMGAPFWFDLLGKLINVRLAGDKPEPPSGNAAA